MDRKSLIEKVKKCLALSESSNENEAAVALYQASKIMEKNGITIDEIKLSEIEGHISKKNFKIQKLPDYICRLLDMVANVFGCGTLLHAGITTTDVEFIGFGPNAEVAAYTFDVLRRQLEKGRKEYIEGLSKRMKRSNKTSRANAWAIGWIFSVRQKAQGIVPAQKPKELIEKYMKKKGELTTYVPKAVKRMNTKAVLDGALAGSKVELQHAVSQAQKTELIA